ncbi:MAG: ABC transporter ATP-binding protein [Kiloniellales bacterium]
MTVFEAGAPGSMALEVSGVSHAFGKRLALDKVTFAIPTARFCVLLGLNGAGKTTLFSLVTRLYDNTSGSIRALGYEVRRQSMPALRGMGVVFQQRTLDLDLSVSQNLAYHAALHGYSRRTAGERAEAELARIGLTDRAHDKVRNLSGGQMRRVEIARALLHRPRLLLLDEPTVGLDINARQDILDRVRGLCRDEGLTVLWATHLIDEVGPGDRVVVLHCGKVLADDLVEEVKARSGAASIRDAFSKLTKEANCAKSERAA